MEKQDNVARIEEVGRALGRIDAEALKILAVVRSQMDEFDGDVLMAMASLKVEPEELIEAIWRACGTLAQLGVALSPVGVLHVESMVSAFTGKPKVSVMWKPSPDAPEAAGSFSPAAARNHGLACLEAAEAAEHDAAFHAMLREQGATEQEAAAGVLTIRRFRDDYRAAQGIPTTFDDTQEPK